VAATSDGEGPEQIRVVSSAHCRMTPLVTTDGRVLEIEEVPRHFLVEFHSSLVSVMKTD